MYIAKYQLLLIYLGNLRPSELSFITLCLTEGLSGHEILLKANITLIITSAETSCLSVVFGCGIDFIFIVLF